MQSERNIGFTAMAMPCLFFEKGDRRSCLG
jgi:hypothetical protein